MPFCPNCGSEKVRPSTRRSWWRGLQQSLGLRFFLCDECYHRFTVRGTQAEEIAPRGLAPPPSPDRPAPEPLAGDGHISLASQASAPPAPDLGRELEEPPAPLDWRPAGPEPAPEPEAAPFPAPEPALEREPGWEPATGPALERETEANAPPRAAAPWPGLWRKLGLGLALLLIGLALLLWYRLNLDSPGPDPVPGQLAQSGIKDESLSLPPAPATPGPAESSAPGAKPAPAVGAIPPPGGELPAPGEAAPPWPTSTTPAPSPAPEPTAPRAIGPVPGAPALAPSAKPRPLEDETPAPRVQPAPSRKSAPQTTPAHTAPAKAVTKPPAKASAPTGGYTLQFGAFGDPDRAMALAAKLKGMGYKVDLVQGATSGGRSLTKVRSGHFPNAAEARKARLRAVALTAMEVVIIPPPRP
jgi:outer membrane biosynthesis protein TonB